MPIQSDGYVGMLDYGLTHPNSNVRANNARGRGNADYSTMGGQNITAIRAALKWEPTSKVEVNYHGWLDGGKVFDSSYERNESIAFGLNQVIPGWTEGMQLVGKGGMIELEIPYKLGYGERGSPPVIPPKANLHFLVELIEIK